MKEYYIYFIINKINGKYYIGQTTQEVKRRWHEHVFYARHPDKAIRKNSYFYSAMRKYGIHNFEVRVIFTCYDVKTLDKSEEYFIEFFQAQDKRYGYNLRAGGITSRMAEESKRKIGDAHRGRKHSPESIERGAAKRRGIPVKPFSEEHRANLRKAWVRQKEKQGVKGGYKRCCSCKKEFLMNPKNFQRCSRILDGFSPRCKTCANSKARDRWRAGVRYGKLSKTNQHQKILEAQEVF